MTAVTGSTGLQSDAIGGPMKLPDGIWVRHKTNTNYPRKMQARYVYKSDLGTTVYAVFPPTWEHGVEIAKKDLEATDAPVGFTDPSSPDCTSVDATSS